MEKKYFKYGGILGLLMKEENIGLKKSILYFLVNENKEVKNSHVKHLLITSEEYNKIIWL